MSEVADLTRLWHIRDAAIKAIAFVNNRTRDDLDRDEMLALALIRLIEIIGEAANHVSIDCQAAYPQIPWRQIVGMRNRIVHAYFDVDLDVIWQVVTTDLPGLLNATNQAIQQLTSGDEKHEE
ncbi:DUF86 domain-containing protein [Phormidium yuhuli AB48]|uniref:DUF86 domain-containing protein n=1 Tax=Phormidium yuhuli AB48 TaxID=2940671 RepID=A0ABY5ATZ1_9CYAN|nr:HepT-like ribonuclease domain-containing protein [Phormidium yuhuli]USR92697.1 DUF86 domain-containing protein [Phormidium yuhuli AB48]